MKSLIIDCSAGMSIYVLKEEKVFSKIDNNQKKHTDELLLCVDELLNKADLKISEIENLCVCIGPGSFTGIRVAISICKGLAVGTNVKIFVASNFDVIEQVDENNVIYILEGFSKFLYVRRVVQDVCSEECLLFDDLVNEIKNNNFKIYVQNEKVQKMLNLYEIQSKIAQNNTISYFLNEISNGNNIALNQISPVYLRASQAEMERNSKLSGGNNG